MRYFLLIFLVTTNLICAQKNPQTKDISLNEKLEKLDKNQGLVNTFFGDDKLYFKIPKTVLGKDLLMVTRLKQIPGNYSPYTNAGSKTSEQMIHFVKRGNTIDLLQISTVNVANEEDPISLSVQQNNFNPILASFKIEDEDDKMITVEVTSFFNTDSPSFNIIGDYQKKEYKIGGVDKSRSRIDRVSAFPKNIEILHTLTFSVKEPPRGNSSNTFSFQVNHSIIELPEDKMKVRFVDSRVGWFSLRKYNFSSDALKADDYRIAKRWRLVPKDKEAYARGELVEPVKPIVYYLDPATPKKWVPYFIKGIEDWNSAFEKAGFKNAIMAKEAPTKEEDPNFNPEDVRYSTVRYVASTTRNAVGPSVADPRTGEIIESDIIWYHNHLRSYRNRYLLETGAANPKARTLDTPEEEIGEMMRRVISHEIGHAIGLPHNMKASSAYPVDSLRSGKFTQKMGIATTIMDYARYNYVAQPGDQNIRFIRQLGPYDDYAVEWGYRYYDGKTAKEVKTILEQFVDDKSTQKLYMFGGYNNDPDSQTENIGDNTIKASNYGLSNLKIVAKNLNDWTTENGQTYDDLEELYGEMLSVYRRYVYHVANNIGAVHETLLHKGQPGTPYQLVNRQEQMDALAFLNKNVFQTQYWLIDKGLVSNFSDEGTLERLININVNLLKRLTSSRSLNEMMNSNASLEGNGLSVHEFLNQLTDDLIYQNETPDLAERELQKQMINHFEDLIEDDKLASEIKAYILNIQEDLKPYTRKLSKRKNGILKTHYLFLHHSLNDK